MTDHIDLLRRAAQGVPVSPLDLDTVERRGRAGQRRDRVLGVAGAGVLVLGLGTALGDVLDEQRTAPDPAAPAASRSPEQTGPISCEVPGSRDPRQVRREGRRVVIADPDPDSVGVRRLKGKELHLWVLTVSGTPERSPRGGDAEVVRCTGIPEDVRTITVRPLSEFR